MLYNSPGILLIDADDTGRIRTVEESEPLDGQAAVHSAEGCLIARPGRHAANPCCLPPELRLAVPVRAAT
jgi:hypothetical protein